MMLVKTPDCIGMESELDGMYLQALACELRMAHGSLAVLDGMTFHDSAENNELKSWVNND